MKTVLSFREFYGRNNYRIFFTLSFILGLTPILWFKGYLIAGEEFYALDYFKWGRLFGNAWATVANYGEPSMLVALKAQNWFFTLFNLLSASPYVTLILWHVFLWVLTSLGFYIFLNKLFKNMFSPFAIFCVTVFYVYNPFFLNISPLLMPPRFVFIALPFILSFLWSFMQKTHICYKDLFYIALTVFLSSAVFVNLPAGSVLVIVPVLGILYKYLLRQYSLAHLFKSLAFFGVCLVMLSSWWAIPVISNSLAGAKDLQKSTAEFSAVSSSSNFDVLSQFGSWAFRDKIWGYDYNYFPYYKSYDAFPLLLIRYVPFLLIILGTLSLFKVQKTNGKIDARYDYLVFLLILYALFTFLSKGASGLFGSLYETLYLKVPFFWIYREPYAKFIPVAAVCSGPLILLGLQQVVLVLKKIKTQIFIPTLVLTLMFFCIGYPFWMGRVVWDVNDGSVRSYHVHVPDYWKDFSENWRARNGYYLLFPTEGFVDKYLWPSGYSGSPYLLLTSARIMNPSSGYSANGAVRVVITYLYNKMLNDPQWFIRNVERYNVAGIIYQDDTHDTLMAQKRDTIKVKYAAQFETDFSKLDVYDFFKDRSDVSSFTVIPSNKILTTKKENIQNYSLLKGILPEEAYIAFSDKNEENSLHFVAPKLERNPNSVSYDLAKLSGGNYLGFFTDKNKTLAKLTLDGKEQNFDTSGNVVSFKAPLIQLCCQLLELLVKPQEELKTQQDWTISKKVDRAKYLTSTAVGETLDLRTTDLSYSKKILGFDPYTKYNLELEGEYVGNRGFGLFVIQKDVDTGQEKIMVGGVAPKMNGSISVNLVTPDFINSSYNSEYYLVFKNPSPLEILNNTNPEYLKILKIKLSEYFSPEVVLVDAGKWDGLKENTVSRAEEYAVNSEIFLTKTNVLNTPSHLQFKNAYNKGWRLHKISEQDWNAAHSGNELSKTILKTKLYLGSFFGVRPINIEYYSLGWDIGTQDGYYAVVYMPGAIVYFSGGLSLIFAVFMLTKLKC